MATIQGLKAMQIYAGDGTPTIQVDIKLSNGMTVDSSLASGSTGEAGINPKFDAVANAIVQINEKFANAIIGQDPSNQKHLDNLLVSIGDGNLEADACLAVSLAVCKAGAAAKNMALYKHIADLASNENPKLPIPVFFIISSGSSAGFQEFFILPDENSTFEDGLKMAVQVFQQLKTVIQKKFGQDATKVGDEGGFATNTQHNEDAIAEAVENAGCIGKVNLGVEIAASEFHGADQTIKDNDDLVKKLKDMSTVTKQSIAYIEAPFHLDHRERCSRLKSEIAHRVLVGDDFLTDQKFRKTTKGKAYNTLLLKVNDFRSVSAFIEYFRKVKSAGWGIVVSDHSGETEDPFIADLSVGLSVDLMKSGAPCRSEHMAKYNRLLKIAGELNANAIDSGPSFPPGHDTKINVSFSISAAPETCTVNDGRKWRCREATMQGSTMCKYHFDKNKRNKENRRLRLRSEPEPEVAAASCVRYTGDQRCEKPRERGRLYCRDHLEENKQEERKRAASAKPEGSKNRQGTNCTHVARGSLCTNPRMAGKEMCAEHEQMRVDGGDERDPGGDERDPEREGKEG